jgi:DNA polymerase elongation subunit (family B)
MQWQFKLFEFEICDTILSIEEEDTYTDTKEFLVKMFGIDEYGHTACIYVKGFQPYFYVKVNDDWTQQDKNEFLTFIKNKMGKYFANSLVSAKIVNRHKLYGFDAKKHHKFIQLKFNNTIAMTKAKNLWYEYNKTTYSKKLIDGGMPYKDSKIEIYEAQIPPLLRLFHIKEISPSGWIALLKGKYKKHKEQTTSCHHEFTIHYKNIIALPNRETMVPYKIMSFDIEASSSHGDFPLPIKNYKKLAIDIIDKIKLDNIQDISDKFLKSCIKTAFEFGNEKDINKVYLKEKITQEEVDRLFDTWIKIKPANHTFVDETLKNELEDNDDNDENEDDENDISEEGKKEDNCEEKFTKKYVSTKKYTNKEATINDVLKDTCDKNIKIHELTKSLSLIFPEIEGDKVTFIGSTIRNYGEEEPYLNHCIVVEECNEVEGCEIVCVENEKEALLEWTKLMEKENPDIIIGYNIHGWDEEFMYKRAIELNCVNRFLQLSRLKNHVCLNKDWRTGQEDIERNSLFIASGQYDIKFINTIGRLQIDLLNVFRREYQLTSYKLDYVSGHFISDKVNKIEYDEENNISRIYSKNFTGLYKNDYIIFEEIGHSTNKYNGGKKYEIVNIDYKECYFEIKSIVTPDMKLIVKWCLGKDDVTPQDIFRLTHEGPEGRKIVAKYCIKDCKLVDDLLKKTDILTGYIEMSKLTTVPISFLVYRGQGIKGLSYVAKKCREKKTLMPVIDKVMDDDGYEGAIVLPPKCNLYLKKPVACVDYSSLYPSSIISENLSHDSKVWTKEYDLENNLVLETGEKDENNNYIYDNLDDFDYVDVKYDTYKWIRKTPKGAAQKVCVGYKICRYAQFKDGSKAILPSILEELLAARKFTKKLAAKEDDPFMKNVLDNRQLSIKIVANSLYGQTGAKTSSFYDKDVAASTTAIGRKLLIYGKKVIEKSYENRIVDTKNHGKVRTNAEYIYGDTDSVFFTFNLEELNGTPIEDEKALEITIELAQEAGELATKFLKKPHDLEYEKTFLPFCLLSKKRYVGILYELDPKKGKRKEMGIVLKRRDNAPIVKDIYGGVIDILMKEKSVSSALNFTHNSLQDVIDEKNPIDKLIITKSLRSEYKNPQQIAHFMLAKRIGEREPGNKPGPGDRIPFAYIKNKNKKALQCDKIENPKYIQENNLELDYNFYITNQIMKPLQQLFALVLEQIKEFKDKRGYTLRTWKDEINKLKEKWPEEEKFLKKYEELNILYYNNYYTNFY